MRAQTDKTRAIPVRTLADYAGAVLGERGIYAGRYETVTTRLPDRLQLHRHYYFELFWLTGDGVHRNDFRDYPIGSPKLVFVSPGQAHCWPDGGRLRGVGVYFTQAFFDGAAASPSPLLRHPFWYPQDTPPVLDLPDEIASNEIATLCLEIDKEFTTHANRWEELLRSLLQVLLIRAQRLYERQHPTGEGTRRSTLVRSFHLALETHFNKLQTVTDYAKLLGVSADYLGEVFREQTGRPVSEAMRERVVLEAKRLLAHTTMNVAEVAYALGFEDPAYFCRYFRRLSGRSPGQFRASMAAPV